MFNGTLMKTVVVFHCLRGRTLTSSSWPSSLENPGAILKNIPAHVTDVTTDSQTLGSPEGRVYRTEDFRKHCIPARISAHSDHTLMSRMQHSSDGDVEIYK